MTNFKGEKMKIKLVVGQLRWKDMHPESHCLSLKLSFNAADTHLGTKENQSPFGLCSLLHFFAIIPFLPSSILP